MSINFNDDFFKFIFFDQYLSDIGSSKFKVCKTFSDYLILNGINNWFTVYMSKPIDILESESINSDTILQINNETPFLLLGGWAGLPGHAINFYIIKKDSEYEIYIINSGSGVDNHGPVSDLSVAVIIKFEKINNDQLKNIFLLNKFFQNIKRFKLISDFLERNQRYLDQERISEIKKWDNEINGYCNVEKYKETKEESKKYYEHIFEILGNSFTIYKNDKPQISSTCTFFSSYYFIKYFILDNEVIFVIL